MPLSDLVLVRYPWVFGPFIVYIMHFWTAREVSGGFAVTHEDQSENGTDGKPSVFAMNMRLYLIPNRQFLINLQYIKVSCESPLVSWVRPYAKF